MTIQTLPENLTLETAASCVRDFGRTWDIQSGPTVVVDASCVRKFDSSALAVLLELRRSALAADKRFAVCNLPARLQQLAKLYGVAELLPAAA